MSDKTPEEKDLLASLQEALGASQKSQDTKAGSSGTTSAEEETSEATSTPARDPQIIQLLQECEHILNTESRPIG